MIDQRFECPAQAQIHQGKLAGMAEFMLSRFSLFATIVILLDACGFNDLLTFI